MVLPREARVRAARNIRVLDTALDAGADAEAEEAAAPRTLANASMIPLFVISAGSSSATFAVADDEAATVAVSWCRRTSGRDAIAHPFK